MTDPETPRLCPRCGSDHPGMRMFVEPRPDGGKEPCRHEYHTPADKHGQHPTPRVRSNEAPRQKAERLRAGVHVLCEHRSHDGGLCCGSRKLRTACSCCQDCPVDFKRVDCVHPLHAAVDAALAAEREATKEEDAAVCKRVRDGELDDDAFDCAEDACAAAIRALGRKP